MNQTSEFTAMLNDSLRAGFKPGFLQRDLTVFQFCFDQQAPFYLQVDEEHYEFQPGDHPNPTLTLWLDSWDTCQRLLKGEENGMNAFMEGRYRADGHIVLTQLLLYLFKTTDTPSIYEVQD